MSFTAKAGFTLQQRWYMFHMICIPLRVLLAATLYTFGDNVMVRRAAVVGGLVAFVFNCAKVCGVQDQEPVWWHRSVHMLSAVGIVLSTSLGIDKNVPAAIMVMDALYGLITFHLRSS